MSFELIEITAEEMRIAAAGVVPLPIEQTAAWDDFEAVKGHRPYGRYLFKHNGKDLAVISLHEHSLRGIRYLWAKSGPVWLRSQSPENETTLRQLLAEQVLRKDRTIAFIRLHARYSHPQLHELIQYLTYDETVIIDTHGGDENALLESLPKDGRRGIRTARKRMEQHGAIAKEITGLNFTQFRECYDILEQTAERDGFTAHPIDTYWQMLTQLGPAHARLFAVEYADKIVAWVLVTVNDKCAAAYYGAHSIEGRDVLAAQYLDYWVCVQLGREGVRQVDLMGVDSPRVPHLYRLGIYKRRFAHRSTPVDGAWDYPLYRPAYRALRIAVKGKREGTKLWVEAREHTQQFIARCRKR